MVKGTLPGLFRMHDAMRRAFYRDIPRVIQGQAHPAIVPGMAGRFVASLLDAILAHWKNSKKGGEDFPFEPLAWALEGILAPQGPG